MLVALHVNAQVALRGGAVLAHLTAVGLVAAGVGLATSQLRMRLVLQAIDAVYLDARVPFRNT